MRKRYIYSLLFGIPGFFIALIISFVIFALVAGVFWIFVFGDNTWPSSTGPILTGILLLTFLVLWIATIMIGFATGKKLEKDRQLNINHVLISGGLTLIFIFFIVLQQLSVGNLGPKSDGVVCHDYCVLNSFSGSTLSSQDSGDWTCTCYDDFGNEGIRIPFDKIPQDTSK